MYKPYRTARLSLPLLSLSQKNKEEEEEKKNKKKNKTPFLSLSFFLSFFRSVIWILFDLFYWF